MNPSKNKVEATCSALGIALRAILSQEDRLDVRASNDLADPLTTYTVSLLESTQDYVGLLSLADSLLQKDGWASDCLGAGHFKVTSLLLAYADSKDPRTEDLKQALDFLIGWTAVQNSIKVSTRFHFHIGKPEEPFTYVI